VKLSSNSDLHRYLLQLAKDLALLRSPELADIVTSASRHASGLSTEFLGESRIALREVQSRGHSVLGEQARADLADVLRQLDAALGRSNRPAP